jgi:hypothetical protein
MIKRLTIAAFFLTLFAGITLAQGNPYLKNFKIFKEVAPGVDFYATQQSDIDPYVPAVSEARKKLANFLGVDLARGAVFVCSKLAQKDAVYDTRTFRLGYKWYLLQLTPEAQREERQARMQAAAAQAAALGVQVDATGRGSRGGASGQDQAGRQRGGQDQAGQRGGSDQAGQRGGAGGQRGGGPGGQEARAATTLATQVGYATLMTTLAPEKPYRTSRIDDMGRSPLVDWLDIALVADATGTSNTNLRFLQDRLDEAFPLDDMLIMNRPFVAQQDSGGGGGGSMGGTGGGGNPGMVVMGGGAAGGGGQAGGGGRGGGGAGRVLPKDVQDRMLFDAQAVTFFNFLIEKAGVEKVKSVVQKNMKGEESLTVVQSFMGADFDKVEKDWQDWVKALKPPENIRNNNNPEK